MFVNKYVKRTRPYPLVTHLAWKFVEDKSVLKLDWNEATIPPSPKVSHALSHLVQEGRLNWYPDVNNCELRASIARYVSLPEANLQYYASSDSLHEYIVRAFIEPGDRIMVVSPTYDNFRASAESLGALVDYFYLNEKFELDYQSLADQIQVLEPKLVYLCNPNNPTGTVLSIDDIQKLISDFKEVLFLVDEAYFEFCDVTCAPLVLEFNNLIVSRTFSKAFALASLRIGYAISAAVNISFLDRIRNPKNINLFAQVAAIAALSDTEYTAKYVAEVRGARDSLVAEINQHSAGNIVAHSSGGNFILLRIDQSLKSNFISFLEDEKIFIRNYSHVRGMEDFVRVTVGTRDQMQRFRGRLFQFLE